MKSTIRITVLFFVLLTAWSCGGGSEFYASGQGFQTNSGNNDNNANSGNNPKADPDFLLTLQILCDENDGRSCYTNGITGHAVAVKVKPAGSDCDGSNDNVVAFSTSTMSCDNVPGGPVICSSTINEWMISEGGSPLSELTPGTYLFDSAIDYTSNPVQLPPHSCQSFTITAGENTVNQDEWSL